jgi:hypothetical protein
MTNCPWKITSEQTSTGERYTMRQIIFRKFVPVSVSNDYADGPSVALIELSAVEIKRIRKLAKAAKTLSVTSIEDFNSPSEFFTGEYENPNAVTDKTSLKECGLLINDDNPVTAILAKRRLAGDSVGSENTIADLKSLLTPWESSSECERICIDKDSLYFQGYIRHTDDRWSTDSISIDYLPETK